jgi:UDP-N-acetylglucosamine--N-acetylmuramyl-(pentapeptide) pyrophosphoryl-undecaprenol N-acetylglucosamine transferase
MSAKKLRIVSYAINGRGMGHLVRQLAILRWVRRITALLDQPCEIWVLTSSEADTLARREGFVSLKMPSKAMMRDAGIEPARYLGVARTWVLQTLAGLGPDLLLVDTFPGGSFGELVAALELAPHRALVARRVRDAFAAEASYASLSSLYGTIVHPDARGTGPILIRERAELLDREQARKALGIPGEQPAVWVTRGGGGDVDAPAELPRLIEGLRGRGWHVVVGAGPLYQGPEIRGEGITWLSRYTPVELLRGVDAAVSAGGYNTFHELMFAGVPTVFLPQPRIADDQLERVGRAEAAGAGIVALTLDEVPDRVAEILGSGAGEAASRLVPTNGARAAALQVLAPLLDPRDLAMAGEVLSEALVGLIHRTRDPRSHPAKSLQRTLGLVRLLSDGIPSARAMDRAVLARLAQQGVAVPKLDTPDSPGARIADFLDICERSAVPFESAELVIRGLAKKFPAATGTDLVETAADLFPIFAKFDDWMGVLSLLRAVPTQRTYPIAAFVLDVMPWLAKHEDLFDAVRDLSRLEGAGRRSVAEVLALLKTPPAEA